MFRRDTEVRTARVTPMAKVLLLLRHAKSSWDDPNLEDFRRPLNKRGRDAARTMGRLMSHYHLRSDLALCSTSTRTRETADLAFAKMNDPPQVVFCDELYHASAAQMIAVLCQVAEPAKTVMLIGHNPGFEELLQLLTGDAVRFPTGALAQIVLNLNHWGSINLQTRGRLATIWRPKELDAFQ